MIILNYSQTLKVKEDIEHRFLRVEFTHVQSYINWLYIRSWLPTK